jgi:ATP-dependent protease ClpP protease subunit
MTTVKLKSPLQKILNGLSSDKFSTTYGKVKDYYLSSEIGSPDEYSDWFHEIRNADERDVIRLHINCPGGNLFTTIQFLQCMADCEGTLIASVEGACMSAATLIMLCADHVQITNHSMFLFHNYSSFRYGKGGEMYSSMVHEKKWADGLMKELYSDFLTEEEIEELLTDKDIWMDAEEVMKRLETRLEIVKARAEETEQEKKPSRRKKTIK